MEVKELFEKLVGLTELSHRFDDLAAGEQGRGMSPRQRDHVCKDIDLKRHCHA